ncbi:cobalamin-5'-phosphate synthase [Ruegeria faecimaris]|uniref:Adenosylcobinamide-GDP ribazoletransferase n=1 Tax=Ruegeria faecimaris TaxID=686389 RepID=A0A521BKF5_9RHOB|nr:cobalamin-5'-phosphate synthase [Ruegeria faecimaris]
MFNRSDQTDKTLKGAGVLKNDTKLISAWDIPLALVLLTRLPVPRLPDRVFSRQASAVWAFPLAGLVVGLLACAVGWMATAMGLPSIACAILVVLVLTITTGAMHEDGLADTADGLWGGFTPERRLEIMKDSHIGTYGVLALTSSQLLRVSLITAILSNAGFTTILAACIVSRVMMPVVMSFLPNARQSGLSHSVGAPGSTAVILGGAMALLLTLPMIGLQVVFPTLIAALSAVAMAMLAKAKIEGQTGDILGATQQLAEIGFLMAVATQV